MTILSYFYEDDVKTLEVIFTVYKPKRKPIRTDVEGTKLGW